MDGVASSSRRPGGQPNDKITMHYFQTFGSDRQIVVDPLVVELLFLARWRQVPVRLFPCKYSTTKNFGTLPTLVSRSIGVVRRDEALATMSRLANVEDSPTEKAFTSLVRCRLGNVIEAVLWNDVGVYEDYTFPALVRSMVLGWFVAWREKRWRAAMPPHSVHAALLDLRSTLAALAEHLGQADSFRLASQRSNATEIGNVDDLSGLDATAFAHLAVLYSIPCEFNSYLHKVLSEFPSLADYCDRMQERLAVWPGKSIPPNFLGALIGDKPQLSKVSGGPTADDAVPTLTWWQMWGWSEDHIEPHAVQARPQPPAWYACAFGSTALMSLLICAALGKIPKPLKTLMSGLKRTMHSHVGSQ